MTIRIGARTSPLARAQADWVADRLRAGGAEVDIVGIVTTGDVDRRQLTQIGGTGVFATAVRDAVASGQVDVAVHSLKDLPTQPDPRLEIAAVPVREDVRDVLVGCGLDDLAPGARIGTGSPRRAMQLRAWSAARGLELRIHPLRGNVDTRIARVNVDLEAVVLAAAGLRRLGRINTDVGGDMRWTVGSRPAQALPLSVMAPAAGQGALALEIARRPDPGSAAHDAPDHQDLRARIRALDDPASRAQVTAERAFLATLEAGCLAPVGVYAEVGDVTNLTLHGVVGKTLTSDAATNPAPPAGSGPLRGQRTGSWQQASALGQDLAHDTLARMDELGWPRANPERAE